MLMYVESQSCFRRGKFRGVAQSGLSASVLFRGKGTFVQKDSDSIHSTVRARHTDNSVTPAVRKQTLHIKVA